MRSLSLVGLALFSVSATAAFAALTPDAPAPASNPPPVITPAPATAPSSDDLTQYKTADDLWTHIDALQTGMGTAMHGGGRDAVVAQVGKLSAALKLFESTYPKDPRVWDAKITLGQLGLLSIGLKLPDAPTIPAARQVFDDIANNKDAPKDARAEASTFVIFQDFSTETTTPQGWDDVDAKIDAFAKNFGDYTGHGMQVPNIVLLRSQEMQRVSMSGDKARFKAILAKLSTDTQPQIAAMAQQQIAAQKQMDDLESKPLPLKFTTVDGKDFDISTMRGKVVLVDFWATWCPPCRAEIPNIVAIYKKYHDQGLEVVGISLDQDKDAMLNYTKANGMVWPQYFDGQGWDNAISKGFNITAIPDLWLVDQKGMMTVAEGDTVDGDIAKLLKK